LNQNPKYIKRYENFENKSLDEIASIGLEKIAELPSDQLHFEWGSAFTSKRYRHVKGHDVKFHASVEIDEETEFYFGFDIEFEEDPDGMNRCVDYFVRI
jgi:hypothetical protein